MSLFAGPSYLVRGLGLIWRPGLRRFVIIPLLINTLLFCGAIWLGATYFDVWLNQLLPQWLDWLRWLLWPVFAAVIALVTFYSFTLIANLLGAPFNGLLSEAVERALQNNANINETTVWQSIKQAPQDIGNEFIKLGYFLTRAVPLLILFLIPGINLLAPILWFGFGAWLLALEYLDYPMANQGLRFKQQRPLLAQHRGVSFSFGASVMVMTLIPVLNFIAMPAAVAGATVLYLERVRLGSGR